MPGQLGSLKPMWCPNSLGERRSHFPSRLLSMALVNDFLDNFAPLIIHIIVLVTREVYKKQTWWCNHPDCTLRLSRSSKAMKLPHHTFPKLVLCYQLLPYIQPVPKLNKPLGLPKQSWSSIPACPLTHYLILHDFTWLYHTFYKYIHRLSDTMPHSDSTFLHSKLTLWRISMSYFHGKTAPYASYCSGILCQHLIHHWITSVACQSFPHSVNSSKAQAVFHAWGMRSLQ